MNAHVNGCSGGVSWFFQKFMKREIACRHCCDEHDLAYLQGGDGRDRRLADRRFLACLLAVERVPTLVAVLFWIAVRLVGWRKCHWNWQEEG